MLPQPRQTVIGAKSALGVLACSLVLLAGCATSPPPTREQAVQARAQAYLQARVDRDYTKAYTYLSPATRAVVSYDAWRGNLPTATVWKAAKVFKVDCGSIDRCTVRVNLDHRPLVFGGGLGTITSSYDDTWLKDNGEWWVAYTP